MTSPDNLLARADKASPIDKPRRLFDLVVGLAAALRAERAALENPRRRLNALSAFLLHEDDDGTVLLGYEHSDGEVCIVAEVTCGPVLETLEAVLDVPAADTATRFPGRKPAGFTSGYLAGWNDAKAGREYGEGVPAADTATEDG